jgi:hypothetical protein
VRRLAIPATAALLALVAAPAAGAATGGASAPATGGTAVTSPSSGGRVSGSTGGALVDPHWVPSGGGGRPAGATAPTGGTRPGSRPPSSSPAATSGSAPAQVPAGNFARTDVPALYLKYYRDAGRRYGVDWRLLAAIGKNESDHGRARLPGVTSGLNFADCCSGPMQICQVPSCGNVWQAYARDGDGDGIASIYDPADAIHTAAALISDLKKLVGTSPKLLMAAYNAGPGNVLKYRGIPPMNETVLYVQAGIRYMQALRT